MPKIIDGFKGDRHIYWRQNHQCPSWGPGANRGLGDGHLPSSRQVHEVHWNTLEKGSLSIHFPNTSSLPLGSLVLPPQGQIGISVRSSSFPNLMSLFEVLSVTELAPPQPSLCHCTKKPLFAKGCPWYFILLRATDERVSFTWLSSDADPTVFPGKLLKH